MTLHKNSAGNIWLLIDFDNTMMGTEQYAVPSLVTRFNDVYGHTLAEPLTVDTFKKHFHGQARETLCDNLGRHFGIMVDYKTLYDKREERMMDYLQSIDDGIPMADGIIEALSQLQAHGIKCAFVSNNPVQRGLAAMRFAANGRGEELARLLACHFFEAGDTQKPKPDVYLRAMKQLGASPATCAAVEDSVTGATAACAAGIKTFGYTGFADDQAKTADALIQTGCIATFNHWDNFIPLFNKEFL